MQVCALGIDHSQVKVFKNPDQTIRGDALIEFIHPIHLQAALSHNGRPFKSTLVHSAARCVLMSTGGILQITVPTWDVSGEFDPENVEAVVPQQEHVGGGGVYGLARQGPESPEAEKGAGRGQRRTKGRGRGVGTGYVALLIAARICLTVWCGAVAGMAVESASLDSSIFCWSGWK